MKRRRKQVRSERDKPASSEPRIKSYIEQEREWEEIESAKQLLRAKPHLFEMNPGGMLPEGY